MVLCSSRHVAGPGIRFQETQGLRRHRANLAIQAAVGHFYQVVHQRRQVLAPLAQRRQMDGEAVEPIEQVLAKAARRHRLLQVLVGGRDDAHVGLDRLVAAEPLEALFLEQPQHLGLRGQRHVADLVEEDRALMGLLELADAAVGRRR